MKEQKILELIVEAIISKELKANEDYRIKNGMLYIHSYSFYKAYCDGCVKLLNTEVCDKITLKYLIKEIPEFVNENYLRIGGNLSMGYCFKLRLIKDNDKITKTWNSNKKGFIKRLLDMF